MEKLKKKMACGLIICMVALGGLGALQVTNQTAKIGWFVTKAYSPTVESAGVGAVVVGAAGKLGAVAAAEEGAETGAEVGSVAGPAGIIAGAVIGGL
jgi:hypothetical protein